MKSVRLSLPVIVLLCIALAVSGEVCDVGLDDDDDSADIESPSGVWVDENTGLWWQAKPEMQMRTWDSADAYCQLLDLGGYTGWVLPSVDEILTLFRGCGEILNCPYSLDCLHYADCWTEACDPYDCGIYEGPGQYGCYLPDGISCEDENLCPSYYWTSSVLDDKPEKNFLADFANPEIVNMDRETTTYGICMREPAAGETPQDDDDDDWDDDWDDDDDTGVPDKPWIDFCEKGEECDSDWTDKFGTTEACAYVWEVAADLHEIDADCFLNCSLDDSCSSWIACINSCT